MAHHKSSGHLRTGAAAAVRTGAEPLGAARHQHLADPFLVAGLRDALPGVTKAAYVAFPGTTFIVSPEVLHGNRNSSERVWGTHRLHSTQVRAGLNVVRSLRWDHSNGSRRMCGLEEPPDHSGGCLEQ